MKVLVFSWVLLLMLSASAFSLTLDQKFDLLNAENERTKASLKAIDQHLLRALAKIESLQKSSSELKKSFDEKEKSLTRSIEILKAQKTRLERREAELEKELKELKESESSPGSLEKKLNDYSRAAEGTIRFYRTTSVVLAIVVIAGGIYMLTGGGR